MALDPGDALRRGHGKGGLRLCLRRHPARRRRVPDRRRIDPGNRTRRFDPDRPCPLERTRHHRQDARRWCRGRHHPDGQHTRGGRGSSKGVPLRPRRWFPIVRADHRSHPPNRLCRVGSRQHRRHPDDRDQAGRRQPPRDLVGSRDRCRLRRPCRPFTHPRSPAGEQRRVASVRRGLHPDRRRMPEGRCHARLPRDRAARPKALPPGLSHGDGHC